MAYDNCTALREDFPNGVKVGHPAYALKHDRDKDGFACETPGRESEAATAAARPAQSHTATQAQASERLPQTGPGEVTAVGAVVLLLGAVVTVAVRRRRVRFTA